MEKSSELENAYALIIGISNYKNPRIPKLNYTHADAEGIFELLTDPKRLCLSEDKIKILLNEDATRFKIKNAITSWLRKNADKDSIVIIFFAGHGHAEEDPTGIEKDNLIKYLLPYDTVIEDIYNSAISNRDFHELLLTIKSKKLVIFMDSCYSGGVSGVNRDVIPMITDDPYQKLAEGEGRIVIAASQPDQRSFENAELGHGVFTYNLLEALSGKADWDNDGYVTVLDAYKYVQDAVPRDAMNLAGGKQEPILRGDITKDFVISIDREHFEKIEKERVLEEKLGILDAFYDEGRLSGKQYEYLRALLKIDPVELKDKNKKIVKRINDLLSGNISMPTFLENLEGLEPELFGIPEKKRQEQERLRRQREEEERIQREKERDNALKEEEERKSREKQLEKERRDIETREAAAKESQLKTQKMANRLEQERPQRQRDEEERAQKENRQSSYQPKATSTVLCQTFLTVVWIGFTIYAIFTYLLLSGGSTDQKAGLLFLPNVFIILLANIFTTMKSKRNQAPRLFLAAAIVQISVMVLMLFYDIGDVGIIVPVNIAIAAIAVIFYFFSKTSKTLN